MSNYQIRDFHPSDIPHLMEICLKTGNDGGDGSELYSDPYFIGQLYVLPYLIYNPEFCMVLHEKELPIGYILGAENTKDIYLWMENHYFPTLRKRYPADMKSASPIEEFFLSRLYSDRSNIDFEVRYPSHLHINLLPAARGKGFGSTLLNRFLNKLSEAGSQGVYLHTGAENKQAIAFYSKLGFQVVEGNPGSVKMALSLIRDL